MCPISKVLKVSGASLLVLSVAALMTAADPSWSTKPLDQWTDQDAKHFLAGSPWVKWVGRSVTRGRPPAIPSTTRSVPNIYATDQTAFC